MVLSKKSNKKNNVGKRSMRKTRKGGKKSKMTSKKTGKKGTNKGKGGKKGKKQFRKMSRKNQKKGGGELTLLDKVRTRMEPYTEKYVYDMINKYHNSATTEDAKKQLEVSFNELRFHIDKNEMGNECFWDTDYLQITLKMNASKKNAAFDDSMTCGGEQGFKQLNIADVKVPSVTWSPINIPGADTKYTFYYKKF